MSPHLEVDAHFVGRQPERDTAPVDQDLAVAAMNTVVGMPNTP